MKKAFISAAAFAVVAVSSIAIAPTTSEAIPAFARQTGAACLSCHFQTFPAVNAFGRAFKMGAFTDVGDQALIEDDNLSLPSVLNASMVLRAQFQNTRVSTPASAVGAGFTAQQNAVAAAQAAVNAAVTNAALTAAQATLATAQAAATAGAAVVANTVTTTNWNVPADAVLLLAGRVGTNTGAFVEFQGGAANWQLMNSIDFGSFRGGLNIQNTGFGPTAAIEISNVFGQHGGKLNGKALSAVNTIIGGGSLTGGNTTSVAGWIGNEMGLIQVGGVAFADATLVNNNSFVPLVRGVFTTELGGADVLIGAGWMAGTQTAGTIAAAQGVNALFLDVQAQGELGDMSYGIYGDVVNTKARGANAANLGSNVFAGGANAKVDGYSIRLEIEPLHQLMLGVGAGQVRTTNTGATTATKVNSTQIALTYEIYQNMEFNTFYKVDRTNATGVVGNAEVKTMFAEVEALF
ncbi:MAG: hypothetical protein R8J84_08060 [Mariprofundales bacterium]